MINEVEIVAAIVAATIRKQFGVIDVLAISPMRYAEYKSVRRGVRWTMTFSGLGYLPEELYYKALESLEIDLQNLIKNPLPFTGKDLIKPNK